jgi:hypothetical protein
MSKLIVDLDKSTKPVTVTDHEWRLVMMWLRSAAGPMRIKTNFGVDKRNLYKRMKASFGVNNESVGEPHGSPILFCMAPAFRQW